MQRPLFSVLLPTKNRSEIVGDAISSVLNQSCPDFELVISDNDDSATATAEAVKQFLDPRIRYFRTSGKLPMHENWENALNQAAGRHILILEDKMRLVSNALEILADLIATHGSIVISYDIKFAKGSSIPPAPSEGVRSRFLSSAEAIKGFCHFSHEAFNVLPKSLDSCAPLDLALSAKRSSPTGLFFSWATPDYSSAFQLLATVERFLWVEHPLVYIPNNWMWSGRYSNGQAAYLKSESYHRFLRSLPVDAHEMLEDVPIKSQFLWINIVLHDFRKMYRHGEAMREIDWRKYYAFCLVVILIGRRIGGKLQEETKQLKDTLRQHSLGFKLFVALDFGKRLLQLGWTMIRNRFR